MADFHVSIGHKATFTKTVSESDVYLFAGITGDFSPNHVNQSYMERSKYGRRMVHGALLVGFISTASTMAIAHCREDESETPVAVGMDKIRFLAPVFLGDTVTVNYEIASINLERSWLLKPPIRKPLHGGITTIPTSYLRSSAGSES